MTEVVILTALNTTSWRLRHVVQDAHSRTQSVSNEPGVKRVITMVRLLAGWLAGWWLRIAPSCAVQLFCLGADRIAKRARRTSQARHPAGGAGTRRCQRVRCVKARGVRRQIGLHVVLLPAIAVQIMLLVHFWQTDNRADSWEPVCRGRR